MAIDKPTTESHVTVTGRCRQQIANLSSKTRKDSDEQVCEDSVCVCVEHTLL